MASEHAAMLRESVADFITRGMDIARVRKLRGTPGEYDRGVWKQMAELGWLGIAIPETHGGMGLGLTETAIVAEGLGRALAPEPYAACAVLAGALLDASENEPLKSDLLPRIAGGELIPAVAWQEQAGAADGAHVTLSATPFEGGYRLNGTKRYVVGAAGADGYIVAGKDDGGLVLGYVDRNAAGVKQDLEAVADGRHFGTLTLENALVPRDRVIATGEAAARALSSALDRTRAIASAELFGVMSRALEMSVDYMKTRVQFGKPIGSFQALQHRAVNLYIQRELASATLDDALRVLDGDPEPRARAAMASRLKARCSDAAVRITRETIQIHGAIGFTDEYDAGLYLKRAMVLSAWLGTATQHRRRYAALALKSED